MFFGKLISIAAVASVAFGKTAACISKQFADLEKQIERLESSLESFEHGCDTPCNGLVRDLNPLARIYIQTAELEGMLQELVDDIQSSCSFGTKDTQAILVAFSALQQPLEQTLDTFQAKNCDFKNSLGPCLTHRIVGGNLRKTRCLTIQVFRSLEHKVDDLYKDILSSVESEIDHQFQSVISIY